MSEPTTRALGGEVLPPLPKVAFTAPVADMFRPRDAEASEKLCDLLNAACAKDVTPK